MPGFSASIEGVVRNRRRCLARQKISSTDLAWIIVERLKAYKDCPLSVAVAIVPEGESGWLAVTKKQSRNIRTVPKERFEKVQRSLQRVYELNVD